MASLSGNQSSAEGLVVEAFGEEWTRFSSEPLSRGELSEMFESYMAIFPWEALPEDAVGFDAGCGSGRWASFVAPRVGHLHCVDASGKALVVARRVLRDLQNVDFRQESLGHLSIEDVSCDFGYSIGVLHHIQDTEGALSECVRKLRPGAPFLAYLYYDLDGLGAIRRTLFSFVSGGRWLVSRLPQRAKVLLADGLAFFVYFPLAWLAKCVERIGWDYSKIPLFHYRDRSFYVMRNDSLDRFGTRLEKRYSRQEVLDLFHAAGLRDVVFSDGPPWWVALGYRTLHRKQSTRSSVSLAADL